VSTWNTVNLIVQVQLFFQYNTPSDITFTQVFMYIQ
jgi:hypothetical protein